MSASDKTEKLRAQSAARQARFQAKLASQGVKQLVILAPVDLHAKIKAAAAEIIADQSKKHALSGAEK